MPSEEYYNFFLNSPMQVVALETLEISHPNFSKTYWIVRNKTDGLTATLETASSQDFEYYPLEINLKEDTDDLDFGIEIVVGDLGEVLPTEIDNIQAADGFGTKPTVKYRIFRSDDLSAPIEGPLTLEIKSFSFAATGATFDAKMPSLNLSRTGETYTIDRFPMLRALL